MIEFLAQMPTDTMISLTMAVLGLATVLIVLNAPPGLANRCIDLCRLLAIARSLGNAIQKVRLGP